MEIARHIDNQLKNHFIKYKEILILLGSRQCGKTTLVKKIFPEALYMLVDNEPVRKALESYDINLYKTIIKPESKTVIIDEIHLLSNPGRAAKIIYDQMPDIKLILTGSSSFHIKNKTGESLAGRKIDYYLYPLTWNEYLFQNDINSRMDFSLFNKIAGIQISDNNPARLYDLPALLNTVLVYGQYPNIINHPQDKEYLLNFVDSLIFKDIIELNLIENKRTALNLLRLLSYQTGNLINYSELSSKLHIDQRTVKRYLEIFEQSFIIYRLYPYARNKRDEITRSPKIYFYDTGIRNALINNFGDIDLRPDKGALFENFILMESVKANRYLNAGYNLYFWRTKQKAEVDLILEKDDRLLGIEIKFSKERKQRAFINNYPKAEFKTITADML